MTIRETDTPTLQEWLALLKTQAGFGNSKELAQSIRIKIKAIELTLTEREGATA